MEINAKFDEIKSIQDMHDFMKDIQTKVSFWGCRYVIKKDHSGYLSIDDLARKILALAESLHYKYSSCQKRTGTAVAERITALYQESDNLVKQRNLITRLFVFFIDTFLRFKQGIFSDVRHGWFVYTDRYVFDRI